MKKTLRMTGKWLLKILAAAAALIALYLFVVFILSRITVNAADTDPAHEITAYIRTNGVHTDIVVPFRTAVKDWQPLIGPERAGAKDGIRYVGFGWGDKDFYLNTPQWSDLKVSTACRAAFYMGSSVMHTTFYGRLQENADCIRIGLSVAEYRRLTAYIEKELVYGPDGRPIMVRAAAYGDHDSFYEGRGRYSLCYTCNSWANNALKAAGQKAALWTLTDTGIFCHYR